MSSILKKDFDVEELKEIKNNLYKHQDDFKIIESFKDYLDFLIDML